jgi:PPOX class probable F420-dependent enzyme
MNLSDETLKRLDTEKNLWVATVRPDGRPHLTPVWFAWAGEMIYICITPKTVKARNIETNPQVSVSLEDGSKVVIGEGEAALVAEPWPPDVAAVFQRKYNWDIYTDEAYSVLVEIKPVKWLIW